MLSYFNSERLPSSRKLLDFLKNDILYLTVQNQSSRKSNNCYKELCWWVEWRLKYKSFIFLRANFFFIFIFSHINLAKLHNYMNYGVVFERLINILYEVSLSLSQNNSKNNNRFYNIVISIFLSCNCIIDWIMCNLKVISRTNNVRSVE